MLQRLPPELAVLTRVDVPDAWPAPDVAVDWHLVAELAAWHRLVGRLAASLRTAERPDVPEVVRDRVMLAWDRTHERIEGSVIPELERIVAAMRREGLRPTVLKGLALILTGTVEPGARPVADIDLLVRRSEIEVAQRILDELGYRPAVSSAVRRWALDNHYQDAPLHHPRARASVDLHWHVQHPNHRSPFDPDGLVRTELGLPTAPPVYRLDDIDLTAHLCLHFWFDRARGLPSALGQLHDVRDAVGRLDDHGFKELLERSRSRGHAPTVVATLVVGHHLIDLALPSTPPIVRRLLDDERSASFAIRRVLAPRPEHVQMFMVSPVVPYRASRVATRLIRLVGERGSTRDGAVRSDVPQRWEAVRMVLSGVRRSLSAPIETRAEIVLDRWAHALDKLYHDP